MEYKITKEEKEYLLRLIGGSNIPTKDGIVAIQLLNGLKEIEVEKPSKDK